LDKVFNHPGVKLAGKVNGIEIDAKSRAEFPYLLLFPLFLTGSFAAQPHMHANYVVALFAQKVSCNRRIHTTTQGNRHTLCFHSRTYA
jgi:hypothetical protein